MNIPRASLLAAFLILAHFPIAQGQTFNVVYSFTGGTNGGAYPYGNLTLSGSTLYGMTQQGGGSGNYGTVFQIGKDGNGFALLHQFVGGSGDGARPWGSLTLADSKLYGMTEQGGSNQSGTIFQIGPDGSGYTIIHSFGNGEGAGPTGSLTFSGSTLYGMTGADSGSGVYTGWGKIFQLNTDGTGYTILHSFLNGKYDGAKPWGDLTLNGSTLYGMTMGGGNNDHNNLGLGQGAVFKLGTDGSGLTLPHSFLGGTSDGSSPYGSLILSGSTLYGTARYGGTGQNGIIFKVRTDGSGYTILHSFVGGDGSQPWGRLTLDGSTLYGMTSYGSGNSGTIFEIGTDGTNFTVLHTFLGGNSDGAYPHGDLMLDGQTLYGMTNRGGSGDVGVIFSLTVPEPSILVLLFTTAVFVSAMHFWRRGGRTVASRGGAVG